MRIKKLDPSEQLALLAEGLPTDMPARGIRQWARENDVALPKAMSRIGPRKIKGDVVFLDRLYALEDLRTVPGTPQGKRPPG